MTDANANDALWGNWLTLNTDLTDTEAVLVDMMQAAGWGPPTTREANGPTKEVWVLRSKATGLYRTGSGSTFGMASFAEARTYRNKGTANNSAARVGRRDVARVYGVGDMPPIPPRGGQDYWDWYNSPAYRQADDRIRAYYDAAWAVYRADIEAVCVLVPA